MTSKTAVSDGPGPKVAGPEPAAREPGPAVQRLEAVAPRRGLRLVRGRGGTTEAPTRPPAWRQLFEGLGPLGARLGTELAARVDLLPADACFELAAIPDRAPPMPWPEVEQALDQALDGVDPAAGTSWQQRFRHVEPRPWASRRCSQIHRAVLASGQPVDLEILRPEVEDRADAALDLAGLAAVLVPHLSIAESETIEPGQVRVRLDAALTQGRARVARALDLTSKAQTWRILTRSGRLPEGCQVPRAWTELSSQRLLVSEACRGHNLTQLCEPETLRRATREQRRHLARQLARDWLLLVLDGSQFPNGLRPDTVWVDGGRRIFATDAWVRVDPEDQDTLRRYLTAMTADDTDRASAVLEPWLASGDLASGNLSSGDPEVRRRRARQLVVSRDAPGLGRDALFSSRLLTHGRLLSSLAAPLPESLAAFYQGLFWVHLQVQRLAPDDDVVGEAFASLAVQHQLSGLRQRLGFEGLADDLLRSAALWIELPQKLDTLLSAELAASARPSTQPLGSDRMAPPRPPLDPSTHAAPRGFTALDLVLALGLLAGAHSLQGLAGSAALEPWAEPFGAVVLLVLGIVLFRRLGEGR